MKSNSNIIIIGGGLSGLSTAYYLKKQGVPFILLEKKERFGGVIESFNKGKKIFDKAAVSFSMTPEIEEMIHYLGLENELVHASSDSAARFIYRRGKLRKLTASPSSIFTSPLLSWKAKLRLLKESRIKTQSLEGESVADFVSRRFGYELYESVANAVLSGIYAGDPKKMEASTVLRQFVEYEKEYGSVIKGMKANKGKNKRVISSFRSGTGSLTDAMYEYVKDHCIDESSVLSITGESDDYTVSTKDHHYSARKIICCTPSFETAELLKTLNPSLAEKLLNIPYCKMQLLHLAYNKSDIKGNVNGFGFLIPEIEKKPLLGAVINSTVFENRAGAEEVTFTVFSKPDKGHTPELARHELERILDIQGVPLYSEITTWEKAIPQFEVGHSNIISSIESFEKTETIVVSGNFRSGVSVGDCVKFASEIQVN